MQSCSEGQDLSPEMQKPGALLRPGFWYYVATL